MEGYSRLGGGVVAEGGSCGRDGGRVLGPVDGRFGIWMIFFGDDVVD